MPDLYPGAKYLPTRIQHAKREATNYVTIHWTDGHEAGDTQVLRGPNVDVQGYTTRGGATYQFARSWDDQAWHAFHTANHTSVGIETEGSGEPWTPAQLAATAKLTAWLCKRYGIPVRKGDPHRGVRGIVGHRDWTGIDGNNHSDTVPFGTGWDRFLAEVKRYSAPPAPKPPAKPTLADRLRKAGFGGKSIRQIIDALRGRKA